MTTDVAKVSEFVLLCYQLTKSSKRFQSNFMFVMDQVPKQWVFTIIFGAKIHNNWFSNSFQYLIVNYHNGIFLHGHIFISLVISCIFNGQKNKEVGYYASFREFTEKEHNYQLSYFVTKNMQDVTK